LLSAPQRVREYRHEERRGGKLLSLIAKAILQRKHRGDLPGQTVGRDRGGRKTNRRGGR